MNYPSSPSKVVYTTDPFLQGLGEEIYKAPATAYQTSSNSQNGPQTIGKYSKDYEWNDVDWDLTYLFEKFTQSISDNQANILTSLFPFSQHSVGAGAIRPETARTTWEQNSGDEDLPVDKFPKSYFLMQKRLTDDINFNIQTIATKLVTDAKNLGILDELQHGDEHAIKWLLAGYKSGDLSESKYSAPTDDPATRRYANKVYSYMNDVYTLLL